MSEKPTHRQRKQALGAVLAIGRQMSNLCFHFAQRKPLEPIAESDIVTANELRVKWDYALSEWQSMNLAPKKGCSK